MEIITLNDNALMEDVVLGLPTGKVKQYILTNDNIERLSHIIRLANKLEEEGKEVFIEVKFNTVYNPRPKRLEIVTKNKKGIGIYKFTKKASVEQDCLSVQRIIDELKTKYEIAFYGYLVLNENCDLFIDRIKEISSDVSLIQE